MAENLAATADKSASAQAPVMSPEIEALNAKWEERFKGLQRVIAEKDTALSTYQAKLEETELATLSPDERFTRQQSKLAEENRRLRAQLEMQELRKDYGTEFDLYAGLLEKSTAKEQLDFAKAFIASLGKAATDGEPNIPDIDMNNPMRPAEDGIRLPDGSLMNEAIADRLLQAASARR
jgi:hypothetical protein